MDGLLLDSERAIRDAWLSVAQSNGVALSEAAYLQVIGRNAADSRAILEKTFCGAYDEARRTAQALLDETMLEQGYAVKPGVFELLTDLRARTCVREPVCENLRARTCVREAWIVAWPLPRTRFALPCSSRSSRRCRSATSGSRGIEPDGQGRAVSGQGTARQTRGRPLPLRRRLATPDARARARPTGPSAH